MDGGQPPQGRRAGRRARTRPAPTRWSARPTRRRLPHRRQAWPSRPRRLARHVALATGDALLIGEPHNHFELAFARAAVPAGGGRHRHHAARRHGAWLLAARGADVRMLYARAQRRRTGLPRRRWPATLGERLRTFSVDAAARASTSTPRSPRCRRRRRLLHLRPGADARRRARAWARAGGAGRPALRDLRQQRHARGRRPSGCACRATACDSTVPRRAHLLEVLEERRRRHAVGLPARRMRPVRGGRARLRRQVDHRDVFFSAARKARQPAPVHLRLARHRRRHRARFDCRPAGASTAAPMIAQLLIARYPHANGYR